MAAHQELVKLQASALKQAMLDPVTSAQLFSVIVGVENVSTVAGVVGADLALMADLYAQPPLQGDGPQAGFGFGAAHVGGVGVGFSWSFCVPTLQSTLVANVPRTGKTCDGAQIDVTRYPSLKVMPEPSFSFGLQGNAAPRRLERARRRGAGTEA
jgi:hypothetical protein